MSDRRFAIVALNLLLSTAIATSRDARAEPPPAALEHEDAGTKAYRLGDFRRAIDEWTKSYEIGAAPAMLFNLAQAHRHLGDNERAIFFYKGFLASAPKEDDDLRRVAEEMIRELTEIERQKRAAQSQLRSRPPSISPPALSAERKERATPPKLPPASSPGHPAVLLLAPAEPDNAALQHVLQLRTQGRYAEAVDQLLAMRTQDRQAREKQSADERVKQVEESAKQAAEREKARIEAEKARAEAEKAREEEKKTKRENESLKQSLMVVREDVQRTNTRLIVAGSVVSIIAGATAVGIGGYLVESANETRDQILGEKSLSNVAVRWLIQQMDNYRTTGAILIGSGVLLVAAGGSLIIWKLLTATSEPPSRHRQSRSKIDARILPAPGGAVLEGSF